MARQPGSRSPGDDVAQVTPRDLHPTSDIRFVITELAKLSALVERLVSDVKEIDDKVDRLRHQATYLKACFAAAALAIAVLAWFVSTVLQAVHQ